MVIRLQHHTAYSYMEMRCGFPSTWRFNMALKKEEKKKTLDDVRQKQRIEQKNNSYPYKPQCSLKYKGSKG